MKVNFKITLASDRTNPFKVYAPRSRVSRFIFSRICVPEEAPFVAVIKFAAEEVCVHLSLVITPIVQGIPCYECDDHDGWSWYQSEFQSR